MAKIFHMDNGKWSIEVSRSVMPGHLSGWIVNKASGNRYVFSIVGDRVSYMREYRPPTNIPAYMDGFLLGIRDSIFKDGTHADSRA